MLKTVLGGVLLILLAYLLLWPVNIDPAAWQPPAPPTDDARFAPNDRLTSLERIATDIGHGPEAINIDTQGRLVTGFIDGRVMRFASDGTQPELLADTGGRPLGIAFSVAGDVIVADAVKGLLRIRQPGSFEVVADSAEGVPLGFTDDVDVSADDIAYYSDASVKFGVHHVMDDVFEHRPNGRLVATDLKTGKTWVVMPDLYFANGVALGPNEDYLLVNETTRYRVLRHWLKGERAGQSDVFIDNLPGFPDNITFNGQNMFWLALYAPRTAPLDALLPHPFVRKMVWRLPAAVQPGPVLHGFALGLNLEAEVMVNLQDAGESAYAPITSVRQGAEHLYFGSLLAPSLARMPLSEVLPD
ncbi:hypothetical protein ATO7_07987 [Oceanococcus atlanticus]|uniref:Strictosidine synthase conserved region domain-containing protein n=1 Tax=Oceanococcus atlanticus TaxID=1317117 RepID=A0A1Y1SE66_9GAMM|nr:SMP-30/gluconolactonase/LRE family protein [Oceanococcus atlanticus]ORE86963.1 hypothetical protein ATO7_07987 [Oceanococcus atlanticus]RZO86724.1 MAG: SMP-30/gluconolactonase/LRE family protein [Oceanococcus sp.]